MFTPNLLFIFNMFRFKQFNVDQSGCAMKINTDGVLLGALVEAKRPLNILDIGTGTGVIALMLAQRFPLAKIDAVDLDEKAAVTAAYNFANSPFADRLSAYPLSFEQYFDLNPAIAYDLIVSNPPFYINSLKSPDNKKQLAKHAEAGFFEQLILTLTIHLSVKGQCWLVLPISTSTIVKAIAVNQNLNVATVITVYSNPSSEAHREIIVISRIKVDLEVNSFVIYNAPGVYSSQYSTTLKEFFTIF